jgi:hypothetical protein
MSLPYTLCVCGAKSPLFYASSQDLTPLHCSHLETRFGDDTAARTVAAALGVDPEARAAALRQLRLYGSAPPCSSFPCGCSRAVLRHRS